MFCPSPSPFRACSCRADCAYNHVSFLTCTGPTLLLWSCNLPDIYSAKGSMPVTQGGKAKLSAHMGELVESDFTHKSENTKPNKQSGKKVSKAVRQC